VTASTQILLEYDEHPDLNFIDGESGSEATEDWDLLRMRKREE
jgi:hypothetical protein